ncbi:CAMP-RESPONSE ELEMENT BINDING PROTEIN-RELATED [Salix purpurea]|uniref:cAMP-RESPONSE ELEMENT BINDING PROTEIN-RELATED n=1 Tax=Salix purpurea TaxID=77065 RepID=A0A9Q0VXK6_SALPP|nr:CAMP-RESPONSE ELEMENT BINDING PROTEIN-RELATED [Salix purpurea]
MGSQGGSFEEENPESLIGQGSLFSLTLDEVQDQLGNLGKPLGSVNLDELLKSVDNVGAWSSPGLTLSSDLSKKTVEEVWRNIQQKKRRDADSQERNAPLGEMTLEDFLVKAGVVTEAAPPQQQESAQWMQFQHPSVQKPPYQNNMVAGFMQGHPVQQSLPAADAAYPDSQMNLSPSSLMGTSSDTQNPTRKRVAPGDVAEKTVERKQKRMIKEPGICCPIAGKEAGLYTRAGDQGKETALTDGATGFYEPKMYIISFSVAGGGGFAMRTASGAQVSAAQNKLHPLSDICNSYMADVADAIGKWRAARHDDILLANFSCRISNLAGRLQCYRFQLLIFPGSASVLNVHLKVLHCCLLSRKPVHELSRVKNLNMVVFFRLNS